MPGTHGCWSGGARPGRELVWGSEHGMGVGEGRSEASSPEGTLLAWMRWPASAGSKMGCRLLPRLREHAGGDSSRGLGDVTASREVGSP